MKRTPEEELVSLVIPTPAAQIISLGTSALPARERNLGEQVTRNRVMSGVTCPRRIFLLASLGDSVSDGLPVVPRICRDPIPSSFLLGGPVTSSNELCLRGREQGSQQDL